MRSMNIVSLCTSLLHFKVRKRWYIELCVKRQNRRCVQALHSHPGTAGMRLLYLPSRAAQQSGSWEVALYGISSRRRD